MKKGAWILNLLLPRHRRHCGGDNFKIMSQEILKKLEKSKVFDKQPIIKEKIRKYFLETSPEKQKEDREKIKKFLKGELSWAEVQGMPKRVVREVSKLGYLKFKQGNYTQAEILFKGLALIDHNNYYYRVALGATYQKQKLYDQALEEYTKVLMLNDQEKTALTNRGECYLKLKNYAEALNDFNRVVKLDPEEKNPWANRARLLKKKLEEVATVQQAVAS